MRLKTKLCIGAALVLLCLTLGPAQTALSTQSAQTSPSLDDTVRGFLQAQKGRWHDMNISASDGQTLYDLVLSHRYTRALEIGTSTGHSGIWIAWALSKTGGRLTTIEIDEGRYRQAVENFKRAGLSAFVDARLADAHELVPKLAGPFDFVFVDADKDWYLNYFKLIWPKLKAGGCYTAHNVSGTMYGTREFLDYARSLPDAETTIDRSSWSGISITYKRTAQ